MTLATSVPGCDSARASPADADADADAGTSTTPADAELGGGFTDLAAVIEAHPPFAIAPESAGFSEPEPTVGVVADLDGDGVAEVLISPTHSFPSAWAGRTAELYRYDPTAGQLIDRGPAGSWMALGAVDLDGDGHTDVLTNSRLDGVAYNRGDGTFDDPAPMDPASMSPAGYDVGTASFTDLDRDGWLDVLLGNGLCNRGGGALHPMVRVGLREWVDRGDLVAGNPPFVPSGVLDLDLPAGRVLGAFANICADDPTDASFFYEAGTDPAGYPTFAPFDPVPPNAYYRNWSGSPEPDRALVVDGPMGAAAGDLDGDGDDEIAVSLHPVHEVFSPGLSWPFGDATAATGFAVIRGDLQGNLIPWGVAMLDVDRDGRLDVVTAHGNDGTAFDQPMSVGPQWVTVHWNGGGMRFADVSTRLGIDRRGQWRSLAVGDLEGDGDPDLVVGGVGELPRVYRNDVVSPGHGFALRLRGTTSNHLGVGARVRVTPRPGDRVQTYGVGTIAAPLVVSEPLVFVGIGTAESASRVEILWPSGTRQVLSGVPAGGVVTVTEPAAITLDPPSRHAPADGTSAVLVTVAPRADDGTVRAGARVELALRYGDARLDGPPEMTDTGLRYRVVAATAPGSTVVDVTVDGAVMGVHPRIFWGP